MPVRRLARLVTLATAVATVVAVAGCSSDPERSVANYCTQIESVRTIDEDLATGDPVRIQARAEDLRLLQQVAPSEIEPSVAVLVGVTDDFARTAGTAADRSEVADAVFRGRGDVASIEAAGNAVSDYTLANCRVDLGGDGSTPGSDPTTDTTDPGSGGTGGPDPTTGSRTGDPATTTTSTPSLLVP